jgi:peroxiredoxin
MAQTPSNMLPLGTHAPHFTLIDTLTKNQISYTEAKGSKGTLVMFICNHCPFVIHVIDEILRITNDYAVEGIGFIAISSNDVVQYPQDGPDEMFEFAFKHSFDFPYLYDSTQEVAKSYDAACTPDFFLFDINDKLVYRGQLDDSRPGNSIPVTGNELRAAIDSVLYNRPINTNQKPSLGCNIKWKK